MCPRPVRRAAGSVAAVAAVGLGCAAAAEPDPAVRRSFDLTRPRPGEMLPNPATGVGPPPKLAEFRPASMVAPAARGGPAMAGTASAPAPAPALGAPSSAAPAVAVAPAAARLGSAVTLLGIEGVLRQASSPYPLAMLQSLRGSLAALPPDLAPEPVQAAAPSPAGAQP